MSRVAGGGLVFIREAAAISGLHQQTIRLYEEAGLIEPLRSPGGTRLYSGQDIDRLRRIYILSTEFDMGLKGIAAFFELEERLMRAERQSNIERVRRLRERVETRQEINHLRSLIYYRALLKAPASDQRESKSGQAG